MYINRLEAILSQDCIYSGGAFYDVCSEGESVYCCLDENKNVINHKAARRAMCAYETMEFEKPSDIDKAIYEMCKIVSNIKFGKIVKLIKGRLLDVPILDIFNEIDPENNGYILSGIGTNENIVLSHLKNKADSTYRYYNKSIKSKVIPYGLVIITGNPYDVGVINGSCDIDQWMFRNFFMVPGHVLAFRV